MHARTPDVAAPVRSTPGWDAGTHPGRAAALEGRARCRPRPPPGEAGWTLPRVPYNQRKCVPEKSPAPAAQIARPLHILVYRVTTPRARVHVTGPPGLPGEATRIPGRGRAGYREDGRPVRMSTPSRHCRRPGRLRRRARPRPPGGAPGRGTARRLRRPT